MDELDEYLMRRAARRSATERYFEDRVELAEKVREWSSRAPITTIYALLKDRYGYTLGYNALRLWVRER